MKKIVLYGSILILLGFNISIAQFGRTPNNSTPPPTAPNNPPQIPTDPNTPSDNATAGKPTPPGGDKELDTTVPENNGKDSGGESCDPEKDIMLNMDIPFIGRCIKKDPKANAAVDSQGNSTIGNVFPKLMGGLIRIVMTMIYVIGFLGILAGGFMIAGNGALGTKETGRKLITSIIAGLILLGASGIILNLINPDFFGTVSGG